MVAKRPVILIILDGWGLGAENESNPIHVVNPETFRWLAANYPVTSLQASGIAVGLPWGEVGNSEVGHLTIGAGKVVYQYYPKITMAIEDKTFFENQVLKDAVAHAKKNGTAVNFAGLFSKGNVHAALNHLQALLEMADREGVRAKLHLFADGKDSPPHTILEFLKEIPREKIATLTGRHYALNRSDNWLLTQKAYDCLVGTSGDITKREDIEKILEGLFAHGQSEEYLPPLRFGDDARIGPGEALVFFNFREDSILQIAQAFALPNFAAFPRTEIPDLHIATFTRYSDGLPVPVAFPADSVNEPLGAILANHNLTQLHIAESYKHGHVTFFFNGHREEPFPGEYRVLIPSLAAPHTDEHPELQAAAISDRLIEVIQNREFDFVLANYSNPDTIAHTGNYNACLEAVRVIDRELGRVLKAALETDAILIVTADHGNMEEVISPTTGTIETQHDANPVPLYLVGSNWKGKKFFNWASLRNETTGILADIAPTILEIMGLPKSADMTGRSLLKDLLR